MPEMMRERSSPHTVTVVDGQLDRQRDEEFYEVIRETPHERKRRERQERRQQEQEEERQREKAVAQQRELVKAHYSYVCDQWQAFQKAKHNAPPTLLPLEASRQLTDFRQFLSEGSLRRLEQGAIDRFETEIRSQVIEGDVAVDYLRREIKRKSFFRGILQFGYFAKIRDLLKKCVISVVPPEFGSPAREAIGRACKFLRKTWSDQLDRKQQAMFSIHQSAGRTVIHIGSGTYGSVFITIPNSLDPEALAEALVAEVRRASSKLIDNDSTVAVIDGDHQGINFQRVFYNNIVVRSVKDDDQQFASNFNTLIRREAPSPDNTAIHFGVPANQSELNAVFKSGGADWDMWNGVSALWEDGAGRQGFGPRANASAEQVLQSLARDKHVIIIVAHADGQTVYMPSPPPDGSQLEAAQIVNHKAEISANKPVVYLFCCETAAISNLKSLSTTLLDCGATAVIAPQTVIDAERSADFFERLLDRGASGDLTALARIKTAERRSKYREMEVWLG
jgi:hypothetical protein